MMKMILVLVAGAVAVLAPRAGAVNFFELETYPATTEGKGIHEFANLTTYVGNGRSHDEAEEDEPARHRLLRTSLEYNYGLTDKIDAAMYLDFQRGNGDTPEYAGARFRFRGGLWEKGRFPVDLGWYVEAEVPHGGESELELEFRPLVSFDVGKFSVDLNPQFELPTISEERRTLEFGYSARVYWRASRDLFPGIEFYGDVGQIRDVDPSQEQEHYVVPMLYGRLLPGLKFMVGPAFGVTPASDKVIVKLGVEYEFTLPQ